MFVVIYSTKEGLIMKELFERFYNGDMLAREEIITSNMNLVRYLVNNSQFDKSEDIYQIGFIGLIKAVDTFKIDAGSNFSTYASRCIMNEIRMFYRRANKEKAECILDDYVSKEVEVPLIDTISDGKDFTETVNNKYFLTILMNLISKIEDQRDKTILKLYFGFDCKPASMNKIAKKVCLEASTISRIIKKYLTLFKDYVRELGELDKPLSISEKFSNYSRFKLNHIISTLPDDERTLALKRLDNSSTDLTADEIVKLYSNILPSLKVALDKSSIERKLFGRIAKDKIALICLMDIYRNRVDELIKNGNYSNANFNTLELCGLIGCAKGILASETYSLMRENVISSIQKELENGKIEAGNNLYNYAKIVQSGIIPYIENVISAGENSNILSSYYNDLKSPTKISKEQHLDISYVNRVIASSISSEQDLIKKTSITKDDYLNALDYIDQPIFKEVIMFLSIKEALIYIFKKGLGGKSFDFIEIAEFFEISEEEVKNSYAKAVHLLQTNGFGNQGNIRTGRKI